MLMVWVVWWFGRLGWVDVTGGYVVFGFPDKVPGFCGFLWCWRNMEFLSVGGLFVFLAQVW